MMTTTRSTNTTTTDPQPGAHEPGYNCSLCPRLKDFIDTQRTAWPDWHNGPVKTWDSNQPATDVRLLIVGLAPGLRGANRTGRPFTGDWAGDLLYATLQKFGLTTGTYQARADDGLALAGCAITNAVRCVPPQNKPVGAEISNCRPFLAATIARYPNLQSILTLGKISHDSTVRALGLKQRDHPFGHARYSRAGNYLLVPSYHCSRYNTNTGRLTETMFEDAFRLATGSQQI